MAMGSLLKRVRKNVNTLQMNLNHINKVLEEQDLQWQKEQEPYDLPETFDLKSIVSKDLLSLKKKREKRNNKNK